MLMKQFKFPMYSINYKKNDCSNYVYYICISQSNIIDKIILISLVNIS